MLHHGHGAVLKVLLKHPWAAGLLISRISVGEAMLTYSNGWIGCLYDAGFSHAMTDHGWNAIQNHLYGFTLTKVNAPIHSEEYSQAAKQYLPMVPADKYPHIRAMMEVIIAGEHSGVNDLEFGLDLILDGLERGLGA